MDLIELENFITQNQPLNDVKKKNIIAYVFERKNMVLVQLLINKNVHVLEDDNILMMILNEANDSSFKFEVFKLLLMYEKNIIMNKKYQTLLHIACILNKLQYVTLLVHNYNVDALDYKNNTPLHYVNNIDIAKQLIKYNADTSIVNEIGFNCLHNACINNNIELVRYYMSINVNPWYNNKMGKKHIMEECRKNKYEKLVEILYGYYFP